MLPIHLLWLLLFILVAVLPLNNKSEVFETYGTPKQ